MRIYEIEYSSVDRPAMEGDRSFMIHDFQKRSLQEIHDEVSSFLRLTLGFQPDYWIHLVAVEYKVDATSFSNN